MKSYSAFLVIFSIFGILLWGYIIVRDGIPTFDIENLTSRFDRQTISVDIRELPTGIDPRYANSVREAISEWERANPGLTFRETSEDPDVTVLWVREFGGKLGHVVKDDVVELGLGDTRCLERYSLFTFETVRMIALHEFGHVLGLDHSDDPNNIMYFEANSRHLKYETDIEINEVLPDNWQIFYPVCSRNEFATYSFVVNADQPLDIYIVPSREEYELRLENGVFLQYSECTEKNVMSYQKMCRLVSTGGIVIIDANADGQEVSFSLRMVEN